MMVVGCSPTSNLRSKLDNLSITSSQEFAHEPLPPRQEFSSPKSLLSKSLAEERSGPNPMPNCQSFQDAHSEESVNNGHPEPSLLATSVGKDLDGRLIPSSSTISLLSLSNNITSGPGLAVNLEAHTMGIKGTGPSLTHVNPERVNSYTNLRSRNSITHLGQQRLQPYHKLTSPVVPAASEFNSISSPKAIPWGRNQMITPDSPNLHPTSIGESPSRFWLNSQTPPASLTNPLSKPKPQFFAQGGLGMTPLHQTPSEKHAFPYTLNIVKGNVSPTLNPVQTPQEDLPMTPLYLSSEDGYFVSSNQKGFGEKGMDYFFGANAPISENEEKHRHLNPDSEDQDMD
ncbi:hypothetical protein JCM33374_g5806 [Metschnikowia sp. JCM 33374]|nr:hypothetical protein JCM33374_g5806 [Metschnikowia sp. JCM 33374]